MRRVLFATGMPSRMGPFVEMMDFLRPAADDMGAGCAGWAMAGQRRWWETEDEEEGKEEEEGGLRGYGYG